MKLTWFLLSLCLSIQTTHATDTIQSAPKNNSISGGPTPSRTPTKIDSLRTKLKALSPFGGIKGGVTLADTTRISLLNDLGWELKYQNPDTSIFLGKQALKLIEALPFTDGEESGVRSEFTANTHSNLGAYYYLKGDYPLSLSHHFKALEIREAKKDQNGMAISLGNIGLVYWNQSDYPKALEYYFKALKMDEDLGDKAGIASDLGNIGIVYWHQGHYPKALEYYFKRMKLDEELGNKSYMAINLGNIGLVYFSQGDYPQALHYYFKALKIDGELGNKNGIARHLGNIGIIYLNQKDYSKALDYYSKALKIDEELGNKKGIARHLGNIGHVYDSQGDYPKALEYYFKALNMDEELGNKNGIGRHLCNISFLYTQIGRFAEAEVYLDSALTMCENIGALNYIMQIEKSISGLYDTTAQLTARGVNLPGFKNLSDLWHGAYVHYKKYTTAKDSLFNEEKSKDIGRLEQKHEFEMVMLQEEQIKNEELRIQNEQVSRRNSLQYSLIVIGLLVIGLLVGMLGKFNLSVRVVEAIVFIAFMIFFEFLLVLLDPTIESWSGGEPLWKLLANALLAATIFPLHSFFEGKVKKRVLKVKKEGSPKSVQRTPDSFGGDSRLPNTDNNGGSGKALLLFIGLVVTLGLNSGFDSKQDSLKAELKKELSDTTRIKILNKLGWQIMYQTPDTAILLNTKALKLAEQVKWQKGIANTLRNLGVFNDIKGNYPQALQHYSIALKINEELNNQKGIAATLGNIGLVYWNQGDYPKALEYYFKVLKMGKELGDKGGVTINLGNIGNVYNSQGDYPKALEYYFKALKIREELGAKNLIAITLGNIGIVYDNQGDYSKALEFYFKSLKIKEKAGNKKGIAVTLGNIGIVYRNQSDYPKALEYYFKALKMREELGAKNMIAITLGNIGSLYTQTGRFVEAEVYLDSALILCESVGALYSTMQLELSMSDLYDTTAQLLMRGRNPNLSGFKNLTGLWRKAYGHYKKYSTAKDSLFNEEKSKDIGRLEQKHEFEMAILLEEQIKNEELRIQNEKIARRNKLQYSGIVLGLVFM
ncbi:MAG: tetratricopeptide repeat protein, partial [Bacteroidia bacterium]|nr:tetratricopeptide repeat protein [Bacteroidia bacterium]